MFTWDTTQPIPSRLSELLDRAGAVHIPSNGTLKADVHIFLPLDLILSCGQLPLGAIGHSYQQLLDIASRENGSEQRTIFLNGSRLLALTANDLHKWQPGLPLPKVENLFQSNVLDVLLAKVLLDELPHLLSLYLELDQCSERGGSEVDDSYTSRINTLDPATLVESLNRCNQSSHQVADIECQSRQLIEMEQECEKQFLLTRDLAFKFKHAHRLVQRYEELMDRFVSLEVNEIL